MNHSRFSSIINIGLLLLVIVLVFRSVDMSEYESYRWGAQSLVSGEQKFIRDIEFKISPGKEDWLIKKIDNTKHRAWINVYTFTLPWLRESLLRAKNRGVDVRVLLEKNPYNSVTINRETIQFLRENKISFHESSEKQFAFLHAKYMIFDDSWIVETANWTRSSFSTNREFFVLGSDTSILTDLSEIFQKDFTGWRGKSSDSRLLAGPTNARERLILFLDRSEKQIDIYASSLTDEEIIQKLNDMCHAGVKVRILNAEYEENTQKYDTCLQVRIMRKPLHAKVILSDVSEWFIGSFNYTKNSLENNREVWIFIHGQKIREIAQIFENDWQRAEVALDKK